MAEPSFLTGAAEKPDSLVSSSKERSEDSVSKISFVSSPYFAYSKPNRAFRPGRSSFSNWAREIAMLYYSLYASCVLILVHTPVPLHDDLYEGFSASSRFGHYVNDSDRLCVRGSCSRADRDFRIPSSGTSSSLDEHRVITYSSTSYRGDVCSASSSYCDLEQSVGIVHNVSNDVTSNSASGIVLTEQRVTQSRASVRTANKNANGGGRSSTSVFLNSTVID